MNQKAISRKLEATARAFQQLADHTIKKDPIRALVELITNSDDSYKRLEKMGIEQTGKIIIQIKRYRGQAQIKIIDYAEGMSANLMDKAVGMYGSETHGFEGGEGGRSFFGRGLKEAILSMGEGFVYSIQNNFYNESVLTLEKYEREIPKEADQAHKDKLGIYSRGTDITLVVDRPGIKIPQFDTLKRQLELHFALRDILSSSKREIILIEKDQNNNIKNEVKLSYIAPKAELIISKSLILSEYNNVEVNLQVFKASEPLTGRDEGYTRQNGIIICSYGAIHDIGLFKFEGEELAANLFGRFSCTEIDVLLRKNEPIVTDNRDGLDWSHPLNKAIRRFIEQELETYVLLEKKKNQENDKGVETESTKKRFKKAIEKLNFIVEDELKEINQAGLGKEEGKMLPSNGFDFIPNYYHVLVDKKTALTLKIDTSRFKQQRLKIKILVESPNFEIFNNNLEVENLYDDSVITQQVFIVGKQIGDETRIIAELENLHAEAMLHVVAQKNLADDNKKKRKKSKHRGMFRDIKYSPNADPNLRIRYDKLTGIILIATSAPSVKFYLGPNGEGQEKPAAQVMTAELVTQAFCRELAKARIQNGQETPLGEPEEALNVIYERLVTKYAHIIHSILGFH